MILSVNGATLMMNGILSSYNGGTLKLYNGQYFGPDQGVSTELASFTFSGTAFKTPTFSNNVMVAVGNPFVTNPVTPVANGTATYAIASDSSSNQLEGRLVAMSWARSLAVTQYQFIFANTNVYMCTTAGTTAATGNGPSGTNAFIADGSAVWAWQQSGAPDIQLTNAVLKTTGTVSISQYWLVLPCL